MNQRNRQAIWLAVTVVALTLGVLVLLGQWEDLDGGGHPLLDDPLLESQGEHSEKSLSPLEKTRPHSASQRSAGILDDTAVPDGSASAAVAAALAWLRKAGVDCSEPADLHHITKLELRGKQVHDEDLKHLRELPGLEHLVLRETSITDQGLRHLRELYRLRELDLTGCEGVSGVGLEHIPTGLDSLDLSNTGVREGSLERLPAMPWLKQLGLNGLRLGSASVDELTFKCLALEKLSLMLNPISNEDAVRLVSSLPDLYQIRLSGTHVNSQGRKRIAAARPDLEFVPHGILGD